MSWIRRLAIGPIARLAGGRSATDRQRGARPALPFRTTVGLVTVAAIAAGCRGGTSGSTAMPDLATAAADVRGFTYEYGGIIRGARDRPRIALIFTGGEFAEGADAILDALAARDIRASFFVTGDFLRTPEFDPYLRRIVRDGHYLGAHSDAHLLYASWENRSRTLVTEAQFRTDLEKNLADLMRYGRTRAQMRYFIPPFEWYNDEIAGWAEDMGLVLFNYSPGTRSNADYMPDTAARFISSADIAQSILDYEVTDPDGLNGFLLLLHVGAGPERTDRMYPHIPPLIDELRRRGYSFVRVDELLSDAG